uniref:Isochorismatase n=1 Tax=Thermosporothrix sp. COM3 TaxID=2490863 RepID=A0A455SQM2_9CHLR|nr:isochorismatase [Thermosporothrix sp. COM3]
MKTALLVIDVQNEYFAPHGKWVLPDSEKALVQVQQLLAAFREAQLPVVHIVHESLGTDAPVFRRGSVGAEMHPAITVQPEERVITKHVPGAFTQTPLEALLRSLDVDTVVISGFMTHICCDTTTRQASERGFSIFFAEDATAARDMVLRGEVVPHNVVHEGTLATMTHFATVLPTAQIIQQLQK